MSNNPNTIDFIKLLPNGSHLTCLYSSTEDLIPIVITFIKQGLSNNEQCIYIHDEKFHKNIKVALSESGLNPEEIISNNKLVLATPEDVYCQSKSFDGDAVISQIIQLQKSAKKSGFSRIRVIGDSSWLINQPDDIPNFMKYESKINQVLEDLDISALCLYNPKLFDNQTLVDIIRTHKHLFYQGKIIQSKYFTPSENFHPISGTKSNHTETILSSIFT